jgi:polar amino acid transport system substrate-binding protein
MESSASKGSHGRLAQAVATLLLATLALLGASVAFASGDVPFVPSFVDPQVRMEKPDVSGLGPVRFLTTDDYPPFDFLAPDGTLTGFNVDLARAVCEELKITCTIQARGWNTLIPALQAKAGDAVLASLAITQKTRALVDFSTPTMTTPARFAAREAETVGEIKPETLGKRKVGVQADTAHSAYLKAFFPDAAVKTFPDPESLRAALKTGDIDLMFADGLSTALWLNGTSADKCCKFVGGPFTESRYFGEGTGIAVRKGDAVLLQAFDFALAKLTARGVTADLYLKYFPIGFY